MEMGKQTFSLGGWIVMNEQLKSWHPSGEELDRILAEMKPIIAEFARRARDQVAAAASSTHTPARRAS